MTDALDVTTPEGRQRAQALIDDMELHRKAAVWCNEPYVERLIEQDRIVCAIATAALEALSEHMKECLSRREPPSEGGISEEERARVERFRDENAVQQVEGDAMGYSTAFHAEALWVCDLVQRLAVPPSAPTRSNTPERSTIRCADGALPDGETCPQCGAPRAPSGIGGGTWVHFPVKE